MEQFGSRGLRSCNETNHLPDNIGTINYSIKRIDSHSNSSDGITDSARRLTGLELDRAMGFSTNYDELNRNSTYVNPEWYVDHNDHNLNRVNHKNRKFDTDSYLDQVFSYTTPPLYSPLHDSRPVCNYPGCPCVQFPAFPPTPPVNVLPEGYHSTFFDNCPAVFQRAFTVYPRPGNIRYLRLMFCVVCSKLKYTPMSLCLKGHLVCEVCRTKVQTCPLCKTSFFIPPSAQTLTKFSKMRVSCKNFQMGCVDRVQLAFKRVHESKCMYQLYCCKMDCCNEKYLKKDYPRHVMRFHRHRVVHVDAQVISVPSGGIQHSWLLKILDEFFLVTFFSLARDRLIRRITCKNFTDSGLSFEVIILSEEQVMFLWKERNDYRQRLSTDDFIRVIFSKVKFFTCDCILIDDNPMNMEHSNEETVRLEYFGKTDLFI